MRISIIIPVYQVEEYIVRCLRSVVHETVSGEREAVSGMATPLTVSGERETVSGERETVSGERLAVSGMATPLTVSGEREAVSGMATPLTVSGEREAVSGERETVSGERLAGSGMATPLTVSGEREAVSGMATPLTVSGEREAVSGERETVSGERLAVSEDLTGNDERLTINESVPNGPLTAHRSPFTEAKRLSANRSPLNVYDIEVIIVDDCGSDRSIALAEEYLQGIPGLNYRILHHTHNRGLSAARNTGLAAAQGEYVYFLDSDDEMLPGALETLLQPLKDMKYDLVVGDYVEGETVSGERLAVSGERGTVSGERLAVSGERGTVSEDLTGNDERLTINESVPNGPLTAHRSPFTEAKRLSANRSPLTVKSPSASMLRLPTGPVMGNEELLKGYATGKWYVMAWNKLCRREFLLKNGLWFEEGLLHEDVVWTFKVACKAEAMYVAKVPTYFYRTREASIMTGMSMDKDASIYVEAMGKIAEFVRTEGRTENRWEYHKMVGDTSRVLYSLLQRGETGLYAKYYPMFHGQCYMSPWKAYRKGVIGLGYLVRDLHYLLPMKWGRIYKKWFYNICYRMRNKRIEGAVWDDVKGEG